MLRKHFKKTAGLSFLSRDFNDWPPKVSVENTVCESGRPLPRDLPFPEVRHNQRSQEARRELKIRRHSEGSRTPQLNSFHSNSRLFTESANSSINTRGTSIRTDPEFPFSATHRTVVSACSCRGCGSLTKAAWCHFYRSTPVHATIC